MSFEECFEPPSQVAQASVGIGTVNMTLPNSVIIRVCMVWEYNDRTEKFKIRGKNNKIDLPFLVVCITCVFLWRLETFQNNSSEF